MAYKGVLFRVWQCGLDAIRFLVWIRVLGATIYTSTSDSLLVISILIATTVALGIWFPSVGVFALLVFTPLLNGLSVTGLLHYKDALSTAWAAFLASSLLIAYTRRYQVTSLNKLAKTPTLLRSTLIGADLIASLVAFSLVILLWTNRSSAEIFVALTCTVHTYSDQNYYLTSAFVWLCGLQILPLLSSALSNIPQKETRRVQYLTLRWFIPVIIVATIIVFTLVQGFLSLPASHEFHPAGTGFSPFEDNHSLGSISVALLGLLLMKPYSTRLGRYLWALCVIYLLAVIANSWSRATWFAAAVVVFAAIAVNLSRKWIYISGLLAVIFVISFNLYSQRDQWWNNPYVGKIIKLVRIEKLSEKSPGRFSMYQRALIMIKERPLTGHGIGSFYTKSAKYSPANDPQKDRPEFAHNFLLQFTAELGIPAALILVALFIVPLFAGFTHASKISCIAIALPLIGYLVTQLTANSFNIYLTNQVFFWWLFAILILELANPNTEV